MVFHKWAQDSNLKCDHMLWSSELLLITGDQPEREEYRNSFSEQEYGYKVTRCSSPTDNLCTFLVLRRRCSVTKNGKALNSTARRNLGATRYHVARAYPATATDESRVVVYAPSLEFKDVSAKECWVTRGEDLACGKLEASSPRLRSLLFKTSTTRHWHAMHSPVKLLAHWCLHVARRTSYRRISSVSRTTRGYATKEADVRVQDTEFAIQRAHSGM